MRQVRPAGWVAGQQPSPEVGRDEGQDDRHLEQPLLAHPLAVAGDVDARERDPVRCGLGCWPWVRSPAAVNTWGDRRTLPVTRSATGGTQTGEWAWSGGDGASPRTGRRPSRSRPRRRPGGRARDTRTLERLVPGQPVRLAVGEGVAVALDPHLGRVRLQRGSLAIQVRRPVHDGRHHGIVDDDRRVRRVLGRPGHRRRHDPAGGQGRALALGPGARRADPVDRFHETIVESTRSTAAVVISWALTWSGCP